MTDRSSLDSFARLLDLVHPNGGTVALMYVGYFDESGDLTTEPGVFCISGYFLSADNAKLMNEKWSRVLQRYNIRYFHMVECAHGNGIFKDVPEPDRIEVVRQLIAIIKEHTYSGFSVIVEADHFEKSDKYPDAYSACASVCVTGLKSFLSTRRLTGDIAYFFESGHPSKGTAYNLIANKLAEDGNSLTFAGKEQAILLQAADLLAWQCTKYVKDRRSNARPPRKDFLSLVEHVHTLIYVDIDRNGFGQMVVEDWPVTRRSPHTVILNRDNSAPLAVFYEDGQDMPIVPIEKTLGWRLGGGQLVYIGFQDAAHKEFALAMDELRLVEAITVFLTAPAVYPEANLKAILVPREIAMEKTDNGMLLTLRLASGGKLGFHIGLDDAKALSDSLRDVMNEP